MLVARENIMDFDSLPHYTREEIRHKHSSNWLIINDLVYDLTDFLRMHPGGIEVLLENMGMDATGVFEDVGHSSIAKGLMLRYVVGRVANKADLVASKFCRRDSAGGVKTTETIRSIATATAAIQRF
ncbi:cytochrome b5-like heme/Steroid binding domain-containing protein [Ditylenchus destructor]|nr:cytochrome b5-like heme/Steroid binding domain-containing protein [Ditylenchus destructor]